MTPHSANLACKKRGAGIIFCLATAFCNIYSCLLLPKPHSEGDKKLPFENCALISGKHQHNGILIIIRIFIFCSSFSEFGFI